MEARSRELVPQKRRIRKVTMRMELMLTISTVVRLIFTVKILRYRASVPSRGVSTDVSVKIITSNIFFINHLLDFFVTKILRIRILACIV